jgi:hypothetical protein
MRRENLVLVQDLEYSQLNVLLGLRVAFAASLAKSVEHESRLGYTCEVKLQTVIGLPAIDCFDQRETDEAVSAVPF